MYSEAPQAFEKYRVPSQDSAMSVALSGYAHGMLGERTKALKVLSLLSAASQPAFYFALVYVGLGDKDQAFAWLDKAHAERFTRLAHLRQEAFWDPLHSDPRFSSLVQRIGFPTIGLCAV